MQLPAASQAPLSAAAAAPSGRAGALASSVRSTVCIVSQLPASFKKYYPPPRQCRAGRSEPRPGAGLKMTSSGSWPRSRKYENGKKKREGVRKTGASLSNTRKARLLGEEREHADETGGIGTCLSRGTGILAAASREAQVHRSAFVVALIRGGHTTRKKSRHVFFFCTFFLPTLVEPRSHFGCSHMKPLLPVLEPAKLRRRFSFSIRGRNVVFLRRLGEQFDDGALESEHFSPCGVLN